MEEGEVHLAPGEQTGDDIKRLVEDELNNANYTYDEALDSMGFGLFQLIVLYHDRFSINFLFYCSIS